MELEYALSDFATFMNEDIEVDTPEDDELKDEIEEMKLRSYLFGADTLLDRISFFANAYHHVATHGVDATFRSVMRYRPTVMPFIAATEGLSDPQQEVQICLEGIGSSLTKLWDGFIAFLNRIKQWFIDKWTAFKTWCKKKKEAFDTKWKNFKTKTKTWAADQLKNAARQQAYAFYERSSALRDQWEQWGRPFGSYQKFYAWCFEFNWAQQHGDRAAEERLKKEFNDWFSARGGQAKAQDFAAKAEEFAKKFSADSFTGSIADVKDPDQMTALLKEFTEALGVIRQATSDVKQFDSRLTESNIESVTNTWRAQSKKLLFAMHSDRLTKRFNDIPTGSFDRAKFEQLAKDAFAFSETLLGNMSNDGIIGTIEAVKKEVENLKASNPSDKLAAARFEAISIWFRAAGPVMSSMQNIVKLILAEVEKLM